MRVEVLGPADPRPTARSSASTARSSTMAYVRVYRSDAARTRALDRWLHFYNHHRAHSSLGGRAPMDLVRNLPSQHIQGAWR